MAVAADPWPSGRGVLVVLNDEIHSARNVTKTNTTSLQTFVSPNRGPAGFVHTGKIAWFEPINDKKHTTRSEFSVQGVTALPRVDIIYAHSNMQADLIEAAIKNGAKGLVIAGVGDGNMSQAASTRSPRPSRRASSSCAAHGSSAGWCFGTTKSTTTRWGSWLPATGCTQVARAAATGADEHQGAGARPEDFR